MADEYNNGFGGFNAGSLFNNQPQEDHEETAFTVPAGLTTETPVETPVQPAEPAAASEPETEAKPAKKAKRPAASRKAATVELNEKTVRTVLSLEENVDLLDGKVKAIAADLLGVKNPEDKVKLIIALADDEKASKAREALRDLSELYSLDEMQFAVKVSVRDHAERKYLWEVESKFDEAKAAELGKFPANDVFAEVSMLRRLQKESPEFKSTLDELTEVLA